MNKLPREIEEIVLSYKSQLEHFDKFKYCVNEINNIRYVIKNKNSSVRFITLTREEKIKHISSLIIDDKDFIMELEDISYFENDIHYNTKDGFLFVDNYSKMQAIVLK